MGDQCGWPGRQRDHWVGITDTAAQTQTALENKAEGNA